jgi:hypothetical protein
VISTVAGFLVLGFLPSPEHAPDWLVSPVFFVAWGVSVAIEMGSIGRCRSGVGFRISLSPFL